MGRPSFLANEDESKFLDLSSLAKEEGSSEEDSKNVVIMMSAHVEHVVCVAVQ